MRSWSAERAERVRSRRYRVKRACASCAAHLYPDYLNIYADRGNIAVLERRAAWRGIELDVVTGRPRRAAIPTGCRPPLRRRRPGSRAGARRRRPRRQGPGADRGCRGGQPPCSPSAAATSCSAASTATAPGAELPGRGRAAAVDRGRRTAHDRRHPARVRARPGAGRRTLAGFENHGGRTYLERGRRAARSRRRPASGTTARTASKAAASARALGTYLHGPLLPRNPWLADWLLASGARPPARRAARPRAAPRRAREPRSRGRSRPGTSAAAGATRDAGGRAARTRSAVESRRIRT